MDITTMKKAILLTALIVPFMAIADIDLSGYPTVSSIRETYTTITNKETRSEWLRGISNETRVAYFNEITNLFEAAIADGQTYEISPLLKDPVLLGVFTTKVIPIETTLALDSHLAQAGVDNYFYIDISRYTNAPALITAAFNANTLHGENLRKDYTVAFTCMTNHVAQQVKGEFSAAERANMLFEEFATFRVSTKELPEKIKRVCTLAVPAIKVNLRKQGKSFVIGPNGENPVQDAVDQLSAAFQAPQCAGVKEWIATYYPDYVWIDSSSIKAYTQEQINSYSEKVYLGQIELTRRTAIKLLYLLGLDGYNAFIERYNK